MQVGTLVIALPSIHDGGKLTVEHLTWHGMKKHEFEWSLKELPDAPVVQWAAFYSDCAPEVHKVNSGTRITITYNLMAVPARPPLIKVGRLTLIFEGERDTRERNVPG